MLQTPAKMVKEHMARAKSALARDEVLKGLESACSGLEHFVNNRIIGKEKFEVEVHISEFMNDFNKHSEVREFFYARGKHATPFVKYGRGKEKKLLEKLEGVERELQLASRKEEELQEQQEEQKKEDMVFKAHTLIEAGDYARAKGVIRRLSESWGDEPGLLTDMGRRFNEAGQYYDAVEFLEMAIAKFPSDPKAYSLAVKAYMKTQEFEKCEKLFLAALKRFGAHPRTQLNLAKLYFAWRKYDEAYDYAKQAFTADESLKDAKKIMDKLESRIFSARGYGSSDGGGPSFNV